MSDIASNPYCCEIRRNENESRHVANVSVLETLVAMAQRESLDVLFFNAETVVDEGV